MKRVWTWVGITLLGVGWALPVAASGVLTITDTIETENNLYLKTSVIAPDGNAAYFGTFSSPGKVVKVSLATNTVVEAVTPSFWSSVDDLTIYADYFHKSLISLDGSTVYFVSSETPAKVVRYYTDPDTPPLMNTLSHGATVYSVVQHPEHAYLYYGITNTDDGVNGILKVNIDVDNYEFLEFLDQGPVSAAVIDSTGEFAYFASDQNALAGGLAGKITKILLLDNNGSTLDTPEIETSIDLNSSYDMSGAAVIDTNDQFAYFATSESEGTVSRIVQVAVGDAFDSANIAYLDLPEGAGIVKTLLMAPDGSALYALTEFNLIKFDITENGVAIDEGSTLTLTDDPQTAVISPDGTKIYVGHATGKVTEVTVSTTPSTYTITYDGNAPNLYAATPNAQLKTHGVDLTLSDVTPGRSGYTFSGWHTDPEGIDGTAYSADSNYTDNRSVTLYAQWTAVYYDIVYEAGDATSGSTPNAQSRIHDGTIAIADNTGNLAKTGYSFNKWTDGSTPYVTGNAYITNADLTLSPVWTPNEYTLSFEENGGSESNPIIATYNSTVTLPAPTREGYSFNRWNSNETLDGLGYAGNATYNMQLDTTLYAEWSTRNYILSFDTQGGSNINFVSYPFQNSITAPANPTKTGHTFAGWNFAIPATMPAQDVTITANWTINSYTVTFNSNEGTALDDVRANYQTAITLSTPTKAGHTFAGWHTAADLSGEALDAEYVLLGDTTLHAAWDINSYTLSFETNGGSDTSEMIGNYQSELTLPVAPTKTGHTFRAWHLSEALEGPSYNASAAYTLTENTPFYAEWRINSYAIIFNGNGVASPANQERPYATSIGTLPTLSRMGYIFDGWLTDDGYAPPANMPAAALSLLANWTAKNYENISISTDLDPGEEVTTDETVVNDTFTIPASAKLTTTEFSGAGTVYNYGTLEADTLSLTGELLNDGALTTKQAISVSSGGTFTASANSHITIHHTPASQLSSRSTSRLQSGGVFIADGILTIVLDDEVLNLPKYTFTIFDTDNIEGEFDEINLPELPSGYFWDSNDLYTGGTLSIIGTATGLSDRPLNYPNPFKWSQGTYIGYTLNGANDTELRVYTIRGQEILKQSFTANVNQGALAGYNKVQINNSLSGEPWPAGVYPYLILQNGDVIGRGRMVVIP